MRLNRRFRLFGWLGIGLIALAWVGGTLVFGAFLFPPPWTVAADTARSVGESASSTYQAASSKVSDLTAKAGSKASEMELKALTATHDLFDQVKAQPLMLIGIGLVLGAAIGAAFPAT